jgi:hypothetical protein
MSQKQTVTDIDSSSVADQPRTPKTGTTPKIKRSKQESPKKEHVAYVPYVTEH